MQPDTLRDKQAFDRHIHQPRQMSTPYSLSCSIQGVCNVHMKDSLSSRPRFGSSNLHDKHHDLAFGYRQRQQHLRGKRYLQSVVHQANLDKGIGLLAVALKLEGQQNVGNHKVKESQCHDKVHYDACGTIDAAPKRSGSEYFRVRATRLECCQVACLKNRTTCIRIWKCEDSVRVCRICTCQGHDILYTSIASKFDLCTDTLQQSHSQHVGTVEELFYNTDM